MGRLVDAHVDEAVAALVARDAERARHVMIADSAVNHLELAIDEQCIRILVLHQPAASDLRSIAASLKMVTDLERIGDLAVNMAAGAGARRRGAAAGDERVASNGGLGAEEPAKCSGSVRHGRHGSGRGGDRRRSGH